MIYLQGQMLEKLKRIINMLKRKIKKMMRNIN